MLKHTRSAAAATISIVGLITAGLAVGANPAPRAGAAKHRSTRNGRIVFQASVGRFPQVYTIEPDGSGLRQITHVPAKDPGAENPEWSPAGTMIAFDAASRDGVNIFTVSPAGGTPVEVPLRVGAFNGDPAYSPDGKQISFDQDIGPSKPLVHGIFIANADGSHARRVTTGIRTREAFDTESQWSPDGKRLAFTRVKNHKEAAVFVVNLDGTGLRRLTPWTLDAANPEWSRGGREILFNSYSDFHPTGAFSHIYSIRPDGSHQTVFAQPHGTFSFAPAWSPDGTRILFNRFTPNKTRGRFDLYTMRPNGKNLQRLTDMPKAFPTNADWGTAP